MNNELISKFTQTTSYSKEIVISEKNGIGYFPLTTIDHIYTTNLNVVKYIVLVEIEFPNGEFSLEKGEIEIKCDGNTVTRLPSIQHVSNFELEFNLSNIHADNNNNIFILTMQKYKQNEILLGTKISLFVTKVECFKTKIKPPKINESITIYKDEPYFVLYGRDPHAPELVRQWRELRSEYIIRNKENISSDEYGSQLNKFTKSKWIIQDMVKFKLDNPTTGLPATDNENNPIFIVEKLAERLIKTAENLGVVFRIDTVSKIPLSMGNVKMVLKDLRNKIIR